MASPSFRHFVEQELGKFPLLVIYAVLEWLLMAVLFVDGLLAFAANELARIFEMEVPCLLCTRIDHVFVRRRPDFYCNDSLCESHKKDVVSFLAYCHVHRKLSDIRHMCDQCLLSSVTAKDSGCDTYKSLVGLLHKDIECFVEDNDMLNLKLQPGAKAEEIMVVERTTSERCSCCAEFLKIKSSFVKRRFNNASSLGATMTMNDSFAHSQAPTPTPRALAGSGMLKNEDIHHGLELPHIQYSELKFLSEIPEEDFGSTALISAGKEDKAASMPLIPDSEYLNEETSRTPSSTRGNRFFGIPLPDSAVSSPKWSSRFQRKPTLEKSELGLDLAEGNLPNELDPDSILHHLKRQVRLDRKSLIAMYMELDEERSASAVAANNAMAMITRLQAEKAAVQMEALQYQRMMEEQAEYDQEALQMLKDMLVKREMEVKELEAELINYREKYGHEGKELSIERSALKSGTIGSLSRNSKFGSPPFSVHERENDEQNEDSSSGASPSDSGSSQDEDERPDDKMSDFEDRDNVAS